MKNKLLIIGAGGHGKVVADIAIKMNKWQSIAFLDDDESIKSILGLEVIGNNDDAKKYKDVSDFFVAIGNNVVREKVHSKLMNEGFSVVKLVHPSAVIGTDVEIGEGTVVMAGVVINSSSKIDKGCILNTSCSVDHDNLIQNYAHLSPGVHLAGNVVIGKRTWVGIGSQVIQNVFICDDVVIGAGSLVLKDIKEYGVYVGNDLRRFKENL